MGLGKWLSEIGRRPRPESLGHLRSLVGIEWVREALKRTGTESIRRRKLPNEVVVWLVIGIALFRDRSIDAVVKHLGLGVPRQGRGAGASDPKTRPEGGPDRACNPCRPAQGRSLASRHDRGSANRISNAGPPPEPTSHLSDRPKGLPRQRESWSFTTGVGRSRSPTTRSRPIRSTERRRSGRATPTQCCRRSTGFSLPTTSCV
jgi:transposase IS4-like protein